MSSVIAFPGARLSPAEQEQLDFPYWRRNKLTLAGATFLFAIGFGATQSFLPLVVAEFGAEGSGLGAADVPARVGNLLGGYFAVTFLLTPVWGIVAVRIGLKAMVLRTSLGIGAVAALLPLAPGFASFAALFLLMATTSGMTQASQALIATTTPAARMGGSQGLVQAGIQLGIALGPALGAFMAGRMGHYRDLYFGFAALTLTAGVLAALFTGETFRRPATPRRPAPVADIRKMLATPSLPLLLGTVFMFFVTYYGSTTVVTLHTVDLLGRALPSGGAAAQGALNAWVGAVSVGFALASALAAPLWGRAQDRLGPHRVLALSLLAGALSSLPVALAASPLQLTAARCAMGALAVGIGPAALALIKTCTPAGMEGRVFSYASAFSLLGIGAGPFVAGVVAPAIGLRGYLLLNTAALVVLWAMWRKKRAA